MDSVSELRVAIIGSGMAGLVIAHLLNGDRKGGYAVTVFESGSEPSLDSSSMWIKDSCTNDVSRIDIPMRAFAGGYYDSLRAMYDYLDVRYHSQRFLFCFSRILHLDTMVDGGNAYFIHSSNNHRIPPIKPNGLSLYAYLFETVYLLFWYGWFSICCFLIQPLPATGKTACESFGQYVRRIWLPEVFLSDYLLPLMSSVATCTHENLLGFPAIDLIDYKRRTSGAEHYVVSDGVHEVQRKLSKALDIRLSARVVSVKPNAHGIQLRWRDANSSSTTDVSEDFFDRVVLAVSPDVVGSIFEPLQYEMAQIPTTLVRNLVHTDGNMPGMCFKTKCSQAQVIHFRTTTGPNARTEALHVQPSGTLVTTCPLSPVCPSKIIREFEFTRVLRSPTSRKIINNIYKSTSMSREPFDGAGDKRSQWRNGDEGVFIVGGWCWDGMVLLEGCVVSAMKVADAFGVDIPWRNRRF